MEYVCTCSKKNRIKGAFSFQYRLTRLHVRKHIIRIRSIGKEIREEKGGKQITDKVDPNKFKFKPISIHLRHRTFQGWQNRGARGALAPPLFFKVS